MYRTFVYSFHSKDGLVKGSSHFFLKIEKKTEKQLIDEAKEKLFSILATREKDFGVRDIIDEFNMVNDDRSFTKIKI